MSDPPPPSPTADTPLPLGERPVRALPVIAACAVVLTIALIVILGRYSTPRQVVIPSGHTATEPVAVTDVDHFVPGTPPAVCERFLRAWMRARYDDARDLAAGPMRTRAEHELNEVGSFTAEQMEELRHTRAYTEASQYDLDHVEVRDLPPSPEGHARKEVHAQAHAFGAFEGLRMDSRRGQTFTVEMVDGAWRVADRTWETFERQP